MARQRKGAADGTHVHTELTESVSRLSEVVVVLTSAVDELSQEIQRGNNIRKDQFPSQHLPLTRLPLDPTGEEWHPKFGREHSTETPSESLPDAAPATGDLEERLHRKLLYLSSEIARLEQISALAVIVLTSYPPPSEHALKKPEAVAWKLTELWALDWLDVDMLKESLAELEERAKTGSGDPNADHSKDSRPSRHSQRQRALFDAGDRSGENSTDTT